MRIARIDLGEDEERRQFAKTLQAVAVLCSYPLSNDLLGIYLRMLQPIGLKEAAAAINLLVVEMDLYGTGSFPSIGSIRRKATGALSPQARAELEDAQASLAASAIIAACSRFGSVLPYDHEKLKEVKTFVGPLAWLLIEKRGGWNSVCGSITFRNMANRERQLEYLAKAMIVWERNRTRHQLS